MVRLISKSEKRDFFISRISVFYCNQRDTCLDVPSLLRQLNKRGVFQLMNIALAEASKGLYKSLSMYYD